MLIGFRRVNKQRGTTASIPLVPDTTLPSGAD
jgi:hypothetical protein